jgi:hypothetical protein
VSSANFDLPATPYQIRVLQTYLQTGSISATARALWIGEQGVKNNLWLLRHRLGVETNAQAVWLLRDRLSP